MPTGVSQGREYSWLVQEGKTPREYEPVKGGSAPGLQLPHGTGPGAAGLHSLPKKPEIQNFY